MFEYIIGMFVGGFVRSLGARAARRVFGWLSWLVILIIVALVAVGAYLLQGGSL